jgi:hypothetical protein
MMDAPMQAKATYTMYLVTPWHHRLGGRSMLQLTGAGTAAERRARAGFLFALPEYERAFEQRLHEALDASVRVKAPVLEQVPSESVEHVRTSQVTAPSGEIVSTPPFAAAIPHVFFTRDATEFNLTSFSAAVDSAAETVAEMAVNHLVDMTHRITDAFDNAKHAQGQPFGWPILFTALESFPLEFDAVGNPRLPILISNRDKRNALPYPELPPEERERYDALIARKRDEFNAGRPHRQLS